MQPCSRCSRAAVQPCSRAAERPRTPAAGGLSRRAAVQPRSRAAIKCPRWKEGIPRALVDSDMCRPARGGLGGWTEYTDGLTKLWPTVGTAVALILSVGLLAVAVRDLPLGTAYAVWTGIGTVGTVVVGIALFGESTAAWRLVCVAAIVGGIIGLKLTADS